MDAWEICREGGCGALNWSKVPGLAGASEGGVRVGAVVWTWAFLSMRGQLGWS